VTFDLTFARDESDRPGAGATVHATGASHMRQTWRDGTYTCVFDPYQLTVVANGRTMLKSMPGSRCDDDKKNRDSVMKSMDFTHFPDHPRTRWGDDQTMTVSEALQWPIDKSITGLLGKVAWHTDYRSGGKTFVTSHGAGSMISDRDMANGVAHLHAHLTGTSAMSVHMSTRDGEMVRGSMTMVQGAKLYIVFNNKATGASVSEHDRSQMKITATSL